ncbi:aldo/keto reductase [Streptomyces hoynatensis]|uniref:Aldo/keto reductase n=1 Tax=Streptomyces hoynatensis TaxID=1141874 RepID=A0A3A9YQ61_9ACTN|nr:aldo/keto reductase [Streptomyces hoynatensis]RKN38125.1 aldo/keto reductase [Streptomyces hoynatensis]
MAFSRFDPGATPTARIGLGLAAVGRPGYLNLGRSRDLPAERTPEAMRRRTHEVLDAAHAGGVRYVDAARSYGRAEEFLAGWLEARGPAARDVVVGSKWGYTYTAGWRVDAEVPEVKDHGAAAFERQAAESRGLLGERLDLYQIHSVTPDSPALADRELHERLAALAAEGVTIGLSTSGPRQAEAVRAALDVTVAGRPLFQTVQCTYNLLEPSAEPALAEAHAAGRTVLVKEALANGRLAGEAAPPEVRRIAAGLGTTPDAVALAAVLACGWAGVVLSGAASAAQVRANLAAATLPLEEGQRAALTRLAEPAEEYWAHRAALPWG